MNNVSKKDFKRLIEDKSQTLFGRTMKSISVNQLYRTVAMVVKDLVMERWSYSRETVHGNPKREVYYLSMEFLMGQSLEKNIIYLGMKDIFQDFCESLQLNEEDIYDKEPDAALGNGGLGRLAACYLDSLSSIGYPAHGCGIRYEYGLFKQKIAKGYQIEFPDSWLEEGGGVWEIKVPEEAETVRFGGYVEQEERDGKIHFEHKGYQSVKAIPYEVPVVGYESNVVNSLKLWSARAMKHLDMSLFGQGKYMDALEEKELAEMISKVLYPDDNHPEGKALRLKQQYFFVSASIQNIVKGFKAKGKDIKQLAEEIVIQINDTHPALAIPELMRILLDEEKIEWDEAWDICSKIFAYTNHTILEEALETWPEELIRDLLPRLWDIVYEINERFCQWLWDKYPGDWDKIASMAIIAEHKVKMAHLCIVGSFSVNGVAQLHANILKESVFKDFYELYPNKFVGITNGVTFRRFLLKANPSLADLVTSKIGDDWILKPDALKAFEKYAEDKETQEKLQEIRHYNKVKLADYIMHATGIKVNPESIFDVHIKRLHEYKRQLMNVFHIMDLHRRLLENPDLDIQPRTFIFAGKAAPGYRLAKLIIKLINSVGETINEDKRIKDKLKVVFLEDYRVSLAEKIIPATDVSEQISTAGKEASGTGNMKLMLNGALTIGTLDGANVEIEEEVGADNIFIFGLPSALVNMYYRDGNYNPYELYEKDGRIKLILDHLLDGFYDEEHQDIFREIYNSLLYGNDGMADQYFVLKDFASYCIAQEKINETYKKPKEWWKKSIINIANAGRFSSDRSINEYNQKIWKLPRFSSY